MSRPGAVAEWLGRGLQSLAHQFDSGRRLPQRRELGLAIPSRRRQDSLPAMCNAVSAGRHVLVGNLRGVGAAGMEAA